MDNMEIYNDDCFNVFPKMKDKSVDLFVLDLPYGQTACKWDTVINLEEMWKQVKRIMKKDAIICFFCTTKFGYTLIKSNEKWFKYDLVWKKSRKVGFLSANKRQLRNHENIYVFKDKQGTYNPQKVEGKPYVDKRSGGSRSNAYRDKLENEPVINKGDRFPSSVIEHENVYVFKDKQGTYNPQKVAGEPYQRPEGEKNKDDLYNIKNDKRAITVNKGDRHPASVIEHENTILEYKSVYGTIHRTEKPIGLLEYLIKSYSNEGDTVMDFTMGSGSCGEACFNTKRKFIGVEMDDDIFVLAQDRLSKLEE
jgi:DNA modification methylase